MNCINSIGIDFNGRRIVLYWMFVTVRRADGGLVIFGLHSKCIYVSTNNISRQFLCLNQRQSTQIQCVSYWKNFSLKFNNNVSLILFYFLAACVIWMHCAAKKKKKSNRNNIMMNNVNEWARLSRQTIEIDSKYRAYMY